jgi:hypothetical protein
MMNNLSLPWYYMYKQPHGYFAAAYKASRLKGKSAVIEDNYQDAHF